MTALLNVSREVYQHICRHKYEMLATAWDEDKSRSHNDLLQCTLEECIENASRRHRPGG